MVYDDYSAVDMNEEILSQMTLYLDYLDKLNMYANLMLVMLFIITLLHFFRLFIIHKWFKLFNKNSNFNYFEILFPFLIDLKLFKLFINGSSKMYLKIHISYSILLILSLLFPYLFIILYIYIYLLKGKLLKKYLIKKSHLKYYYFSFGLLFIIILFFDLKTRKQFQKGGYS